MKICRAEQRHQAHLTEMMHGIRAVLFTLKPTEVTQVLNLAAEKKLKSHSF